MRLYHGSNIVIDNINLAMYRMFCAWCLRITGLPQMLRFPVVFTVIFHSHWWGWLSLFCFIKVQKKRMINLSAGCGWQSYWALLSIFRLYCGRMWSQWSVCWWFLKHVHMYGPCWLAIKRWKKRLFNRISCGIKKINLPVYIFPKMSWHGIMITEIALFLCPLVWVW